MKYASPARRTTRQATITLELDGQSVAAYMTLSCVSAHPVTRMAG